MAELAAAASALVPAAKLSITALAAVSMAGQLSPARGWISGAALAQRGWKPAMLAAAVAQLPAFS